MITVGLRLFEWFVVCLVRCFVRSVAVCILLCCDFLLFGGLCSLVASLLVYCSLLVGGLYVNSVGMIVLDLY